MSFYPEEIVDDNACCLRNHQTQFDGWIVILGFYQTDGLARYADGIGEFLLGQPRLQPCHSYAVANLNISHEPTPRIDFNINVNYILHNVKYILHDGQKESPPRTWRALRINNTE